MQTYSLRINGMTCGGCAASIQRKLEALDGINQCEVNFATESARIKSDSVIHPKQLIDWVRSFGFSVQTEEHRFTVSDKQLDQQLLTSIFDSDQNIVAYQLNPDLQTVTYTALPDADHESLDQALLALGLVQTNEVAQTSSTYGIYRTAACRDRRAPRLPFGIANDWDVDWISLTFTGDSRVGPRYPNTVLARTSILQGSDRSAHSLRG